MEKALSARPLALARWLLIVAALVLVMVVVGGITRLTESGLSITRWDLVTGTLPPLSDEAWREKSAKMAPYVMNNDDRNPTHVALEKIIADAVAARA